MTGARMDELTAGSRTTSIAAAVVMTLGLIIVVYGIVVGDLARSLGGACLTMPALMLLALIAIRRWTTDTTQERANLAEAQRATDEEHMRYVAAQAALLTESQRLQRDAAYEREQLKARLAAERAAMQEALEERRATIMCEAMEATVKMLLDGDLTAEPSKTHGKVMQFPTQLPARPRQESARDRGATRG